MCHPQADLCLVHSKVLSFVDRHHQSLFNSLRNTNTSVSLFLICCSSSHQTIRPRHHQPIELCRDDSSHTFPDVYSSQSSLLLVSASRRTSHLVPNHTLGAAYLPPRPSVRPQFTRYRTIGSQRAFGIKSYRIWQMQQPPQSRAAVSSLCCLERRPSERCVAQAIILSQQ
jgi:hypothetical protein